MFQSHVLGRAATVAAVAAVLVSARGAVQADPPVRLPSGAQNSAPQDPPPAAARAVERGLHLLRAAQNPLAQQPALTPYGRAAELVAFLDVGVVDAGDDLLGATLQPVPDGLRAQLALPAGEGVLASSVREDGPAALAGLKSGDVLLSLGGKPLSEPADLARQLKAAGDNPASLKVLRAGKPLALSVRPVFRVTLGPAVEQKSEYFIGVQIGALDDILRGHLGLKEGQGVLVEDAIAGSPAEKAGVKKHDIILELGGKPVGSPEALTAQVQAGRDAPTALQVLRAGKPLTVPVTPGIRKVDAGPPSAANLRFYVVPDRQRTVWAINSYNVAHPVVAPLVPDAGSEEVRHRLDRLEKEMKALRESIDRLVNQLKPDVPGGKE